MLSKKIKKDSEKKHMKDNLFEEEINNRQKMERERWNFTEEVKEKKVSVLL